MKFSFKTWWSNFKDALRELFLHGPDTNESELPTKKLIGLDIPEILSQWVGFKFPTEHVIILMNINVEAKNISFWAKVPQQEIGHFLKDTVILRCKDPTEVQRLVENIPVNFADAFGFSAGNLITYNMEEPA